MCDSQAILTVLLVLTELSWLLVFTRSLRVKLLHGSLLSPSTTEIVGSGSPILLSPRTLLFSLLVLTLGVPSLSHF